MNCTLVIHPKDESTDFLREIYRNKNFDVIDDPDVSREQIREAIKSHDNIMMMGHGTGDGLINPRYFARPPMRDGKQRRPFIIDASHADLLREKNTISIWCHSDQYYQRNNLSDGNLHTGMIISEVLEEMFILGDAVLNKGELLENMNRFAAAVRASLDMEPAEMQRNICRLYDGDDAVSRFNRKNIRLV